MTKMIVNADDFGMNENVTRAILRCFEEGLITQTTLMVNMPYCTEAVRLAKKLGFDNRIGLHVNLSEGTPLTEPIKRISAFCNRDGTFNNRIRERCLYKFFIPFNARKAVKIEVEAQMKKFFELGLTLPHYDSHGHVAAFHSILPIALDCARRFKFKTTRIWINLSGNSAGKRISWFKRLYSFVGAMRIKLAGLSHVNWFGYAWDAIREYDRIKDGSVEVMCHPCYREGNELDITGDLKDWKTPYLDSIGKLQTLHDCSFGLYCD